MILRIVALTALAVGLLELTGSPIASQESNTPRATDPAQVKEALAELQGFIGLWNLEGTQKTGGKTEAWKEKVSWGWKFTDRDICLTVDFAQGKGKYFTAGVLRYDTARNKYVLTLTRSDKTEQVFEGGLIKGGLKLERTDPATGDVHRLTLITLAEGIRFQLKYEKQDGGKGIFASQFALNGSKDGESFAGSAKKPECIVSGGAATIAVSYQGKTYYVCCSGCRDEFNANPAKYVTAKK
jgi:YHS domain-containing protein